MVQVTKNDAKTGGYHLTLMTGLNDNANDNPNGVTYEELLSDMAKVASEDAAMKVRTNLAEYLEKGIVK